MRRPIQATASSALSAVALTMLIAWLAALRAPQAGTSAPPKPSVPVATSTVVANPDAYYGVPVTLTAAVEQILSRSAFSVAQRRVGNTGNGTGNASNGATTIGQDARDILVLAPT